MPCNTEETVNASKCRRKSFSKEKSNISCIYKSIPAKFFAITYCVEIKMFVVGATQPNERILNEYFFTLREWDFDFSTFTSNWKNLGSAHSGKTFCAAIFKAAKLLHSLPARDSHQLYNFLSQPGILNDWAHHAQTKLEECNGKNLSYIVWSLGEINVPTSRKLILALTKEASEKLTSMNSKDMKDIIQGFQKLRIYPGDRFMETWFQNIISKIPDLSLYHLSYLNWMLANIAAKPPSNFMKECVTRTNTLIDQKDANSIDLRMYLWSMTVLSVTSGHNIPKKHAQKLIDIIDSIDPDNFYNQGIFHQACHYFDLPHSDKSNHEFDQISPFEIYLAKQFNKVSGFELSKKERIVGVQHVPDIVGTFNDRRIIIEADGIHHFNNVLDGVPMFNGSTRLQTVLLSKSEPESTILRLSCFDFNRVSKSITESDFEKLLCRLSQAEPGVYKSKIKNRKLDFIPFFRNRPNVTPGENARHDIR